MGWCGAPNNDDHAQRSRSNAFVALFDCGAITPPARTSTPRPPRTTPRKPGRLAPFGPLTKNYLLLFFLSANYRPGFSCRQKLFALPSFPNPSLPKSSSNASMAAALDGDVTHPCTRTLFSSSLRLLCSRPRCCVPGPPLVFSVLCTLQAAAPRRFPDADPTTPILGRP